MNILLEFQNVLLKIVSTINSYLSDYVLIIFLLGVGLFFSIKTRFVQIRYFKQACKKLFGDFTINGEKNPHTLTSFQALATAVAAQIGTGNIVGASGAILTGGPGAVFWMWIIAFLGMATSYAETVLVINTRKKNSKTGAIIGGPSYYIKQAFKGKNGVIMSTFFSICAIPAMGFFGQMIPSNSIAATFSNAFNVKPIIIGIILVILCGVIFFGGLKVLTNVLEKIVPLMAFTFITGSLIVLIIRYKQIPEAISLIFKYAFMPDAIIGGGIGYALKTVISQGAKRGLFSNEAGMGSTPHAHVLANVKTAHEQGMIAMMGVFIDTIVVLNLNAFVIISTLYTKGGLLENGYTDGVTTILNNNNLAQTAFGSIMGKDFGNILIAICLFFFAFSTILGWNLFAKMNFEYLFGKKHTYIYTTISIIFVFLGTVTSNDLIWQFQDMFDQLMVIPNVLALFLLSSIILAEVKKADTKKNRMLKK